jgi:uncharacterized membrane protein HdeD (DUF308 family)
MKHAYASGVIIVVISVLIFSIAVIANDVKAVPLGVVILCLGIAEIYSKKKDISRKKENAKAS